NSPSRIPVASARTYSASSRTPDAAVRRVRTCSWVKIAISCGSNRGGSTISATLRTTKLTGHVLEGVDEVLTGTLLFGLVDQVLLLRGILDALDRDHEVEGAAAQVAAGGGEEVV